GATIKAYELMGLRENQIKPHDRLLLGCSVRHWRALLGLQDVALQTVARVPEHGVDEHSSNRPGDAERQARLDSHAVSEPRLAGRKLLQQVVLRKRMDERHGSCGEIEREAAIPLPAEEMLVSAAQRQPNRPVGSDAVGLTAGPSHLAHPGKP